VKKKSNIGEAKWKRRKYQRRKASTMAAKKVTAISKIVNHLSMKKCWMTSKKERIIRRKCDINTILILWWAYKARLSDMVSKASAVYSVQWCVAQQWLVICQYQWPVLFLCRHCAIPVLFKYSRINMTIGVLSINNVWREGRRRNDV